MQLPRTGKQLDLRHLTRYLSAVQQRAEQPLSADERGREGAHAVL